MSFSPTADAKLSLSSDTSRLSSSDLLCLVSPRVIVLVRAAMNFFCAVTPVLEAVFSSSSPLIWGQGRGKL